jgi:hypothetical protein
MAWEGRKRGGRYYTRSVRHGGRVERQYLGRGPAAERAAAFDALAQARREQEREVWREEQAHHEALDRSVADFCAAVELLVCALLVLAGYHRHDRGEWRRRRG